MARELVHVDRRESALGRAGLTHWLALLSRALRRPGALIVVIALGLALHSFSLGLGLTADDHFHAVALRQDLHDAGMERAPWDLFAFAKAPETNRALMENGSFPWWTDPALIISFFRPLSSLSLWLDYQLWPGTAWAMHVHSLAWFALLLVCAWRVYRDLCGTRELALLSLLLFAIDDARSMPVGWIANRNALVALAPGFVALALHHRYRTTGAGRWALLGPVCFALGLLGGESALSVLGYLVSYALFIDHDTPRKRALALLPYALITLVWALVYDHLGYGALHSGVYLDPGHDPRAFVEALGVRLPVLLLSQFALPPSDLWEVYPLFSPLLQPLVFALALCVLAAFFYLLRPLLRDDPRVRFWALGSLLATIPVCATHPEDRVLTATGLGGAALLAQLLLSLARRVRTRPVLNTVGQVLLFIHVVAAPALLPLRALAISAFEDLMLRADPSIPSGPGSQRTTVVLLNPPVDLLAVYLPAFRLSRGVSGPGRLRWLSTGESELRVTRRDRHTLRVEPEDGFLSTSSQRMFRRTATGLSPAEPVRLSGVTFHVVRTSPDGRPEAVDVRFDADLDDPRFAWLEWRNGRYEPIALPRVGEQRTIAKVPPSELFFD